jgi:hypothetical protein
MYELNLLPDKKTIDSAEPVEVYWLRYTEKGQRKELNYIERTIAYGVRCEKINDKTFRMNFTASKSKFAEVIVTGEGSGEAIMKIGNNRSKLHKVFVKVSDSGLWPKVSYVEFFGTDVSTKKSTYEKMKI